MCTHTHNLLSPGLLHPAVVDGRRHGDRHRGGGDVTDDVQCLLEGVVHAEHLVAVMGLLLGLLHQAVLVPRVVQVGQQLRVDELLGLCGGGGREGRVKVRNGGSWRCTFLFTTIT